MSAVPHENRLPSTGVVLLSHPRKAYDFEDWARFIPVDPAEENICWSLADGVHSFVAKDPDGVGLLVLQEPAVDELSLFSLRDDLLFDDEVRPSDPPVKECLVVQRSDGHANRRFTILARESIVTSSGLAYMAKPYQYDILKALRKLIVPFLWEENVQTLKSALRLAVHKLSPENLGATFLILSPQDFSTFDEGIGQQLIINQAVRPYNYSLTDRRQQRPLVHLMGQMDGVTTISPDGNVLHVGAFFPSVGGETAQHYGTRHRSAAEFTKSMEGIAIVISSDGPVTVFRKGEALPVPTVDA
jgi:DNA integrity scanning protein DisA with diadenylate cyclase activity